VEPRVQKHFWCIFGPESCPVKTILVLFVLSNKYKFSASGFFCVKLPSQRFVVGLITALSSWTLYCRGCSGLVAEHRTYNRELAGSTHTRSTASNLEQVANLLCAQANSASYPQRDGKWVSVVATATGWMPSMADLGDGVSARCIVGSIVH